MYPVRFQGNIINYKHKIEPIKDGDKFIPNHKAFAEIAKKSVILMLPKDFIKYQEKGEIILVNQMGGWCTLLKDMELLEKIVG